MSEWQHNPVTEPVDAESAGTPQPPSSGAEPEHNGERHNAPEASAIGEVSSDNADLLAADAPAIPRNADPISASDLTDTPTGTPTTARPRTSLVGSIMGTAQSLCTTVVIAVFVITFIVQAFQIPSESMENTLLIGDYLLVDKIHYGQAGTLGKVEPYSTIKRGDIIVFRYPVNPTQHFVKRVIGVPGDRVRLIRKRVFVNGRMLTEPYVVYSRGFNQYPDNFPVPGLIDPQMELSWHLLMDKLVEGRELIVPEGNYFVLGDNRDKSLDSRYWGFVPRENIIGRPLLIYFSMRRPIEISTPLSSFSDKLHDLTYNLSDLSGRIRWRRTFRLIK